MADTKESIYFAGFFDGEGSVAIYPRKYVVSLTNTDIRPLVRAQELWGGGLSRQRVDLAGVQVIWRWQIYGQKATPFLIDIRPFVLIKGEQVDIFLAVLKVIPTARGARRMPGVAALVTESAERLRLLKRGA